MDDETTGRPIIVIANKPLGDYWMSVAIEAEKGNQEVLLHFTDHYAGHAELFLRLMRHFGWIENNRGKTTTQNLICKYKDYHHNGVCTNPNIKTPVRCTESIRVGCKYYERLSMIPMRVNWILIEQIPSIRDL